MNKTILAIGGHPDDMEQFAGGTLYLLKKAGYNVIIAALTAGECGSHTFEGSEIARIRLKEAKKGASVIGADYINLGIKDGSLEYNLETTKKVVALIRKLKPQIIITHPVDDYMTDHFHAAKLVLWAIPEAMHKNFIVNSSDTALSAMPHVYHTDPQGLTGSDGQIARVNTIVDISDVVKIKLQAFSSHESQVNFLHKRKNKMNSVEKTNRWTITRGEQVRIAHGEGFYQELHAEYPRTNLLKDILKEKVFTL